MTIIKHHRGAITTQSNIQQRRSVSDWVGRNSAWQLGRVRERVLDLHLDVNESGRGSGKLPIHEGSSRRVALDTRPKSRAHAKENNAALVVWHAAYECSCLLSLHDSSIMQVLQALLIVLCAAQRRRRSSSSEHIDMYQLYCCTAPAVLHISIFTRCCGAAVASLVPE